MFMYRIALYENLVFYYMHMLLVEQFKHLDTLNSRRKALPNDTYKYNQPYTHGTACLHYIPVFPVHTKWYVFSKTFHIELELIIHKI